MSLRVNPRGMRDAPTILRDEIDELASEIERYLDAVETFRSLGHEPYWRPESPSDLVVRVREWLEPCEQHVSGR